jgi:predicted phosphoribosyltransferase
MQAAVQGLKHRGVSKVFVAVPVASREAIERLRSQADDVICLHAPLFFNAVGEWYDDFSQTQDDEVRSLLAAAAQARKPAEKMT